VRQSVNHLALHPGSCFLMLNSTPSRLTATAIPLRAYSLLRTLLIWPVPMTQTGTCHCCRTPRPRPRPCPRPWMSSSDQRKPLPHLHLPRKSAHTFLGYAPGYGLRVDELPSVLQVSLPTSFSYWFISYLVYLSPTNVLLIHTRSLGSGMSFSRISAGLFVLAPH